MNPTHLTYIAIGIPLICTGLLAFLLCKRSESSWQVFTTVAALAFWCSFAALIAAGKIATFSFAGASMAVEEKVQEANKIATETRAVAKATAEAAISLARPFTGDTTDRLEDWERMRASVESLLRTAGENSTTITNKLARMDTYIARLRREQQN